MGKEVLLEVKDLEVSFGRGRKKYVAVKQANFKIFKGETLGLVGESGSGKTTIGRAIMRIIPITRGEIVYRGERISGSIPAELHQRLIKDIQMIFQDPQASLNERAKVDYIISEGLMNIEKGLSRTERRQRVEKILKDVGLLPEFAGRFPHEFSGGQRQRIGIARAMIMNPEFIIADEPISALDVSIRAQVLNLLTQMQRKHQITYLFIAHDLSVMRYITDRLAVIYKGQIVELAETGELLSHPVHPYTRALISAVPEPDPVRGREKKLLIYDPSCHDYSVDPAAWLEVRPRHYVLANRQELAEYQKR